MKEEEYQHILVESFEPKDRSGRHGEVHIKPLPNQEPFNEEYFVSCNKELSEKFEVGTKFRIKAKIKNNQEGVKTCIYSHYSWPYEVLKL